MGAREDILELQVRGVGKLPSKRNRTTCNAGHSKPPGTPKGWRCPLCRVDHQAATNAKAVSSRDVADFKVSIGRDMPKPRTSKSRRLADGRAGIRQSDRRHRLKKYSLTVEAFESMLKAQEYRCLICAQEIAESRQLAPGRNGNAFRLVATATTACVDHCHEGGQVRGLLCLLCNRGLGDFKDNSARLRAAADYLDKHR